MNALKDIVNAIKDIVNALKDIVNVWERGSVLWLWLLWQQGFFDINREQEKLKWKDFTKKQHKIVTL